MILYGGVTVNQAAKVKKALTFGSKSFNGLSAQTITAADLGALTGVPLANGNTVGGIKAAGDVTVSNGAVTVLSANQVKHVLKFHQDQITGEASLPTIDLTFNGLNGKTIKSGDGIHFQPIGAIGDDLYNGERNYN